MFSGFGVDSCSITLVTSCQLRWAGGQTYSVSVFFCCQRVAVWDVDRNESGNNKPSYSWCFFVLRGQGVEIMGVEGAVGNTYEIVLAPKTTLAFRDCCFLPDIIGLVFHARSSHTLAPRPKYISLSHRIVCHRRTVHRQPGYHNPSISAQAIRQPGFLRLLVASSGISRTCAHALRYHGIPRLFVANLGT